MITRQKIIAVINQCIIETKSQRKKNVGLPRLRTEILQIQGLDIEAMIRLLETAVSEPEPTGKNPPDSASRYWVNRHSWSVFRGGASKTSTRKKLEEIIADYRGLHPLVAPAPRKPLILQTTTVIDERVITRMKSASRRADHEIVLLGHGETTLGPGNQTTIPDGTTVVFYTPDQAFLRNVDVRAIAVPEVWGRHQRPKVQEIAGPGAVIQDHRIGELDPSGIGHTAPAEQLGGTWMALTATPRKLSSILKPNMGNVHWAACRAHPTDDMIAFNAGEGQNEPGPEPNPLTDVQIDRLARQGGRP
ncbi:MAG: hypothetical protein MUC41_15960 [Syntrophobacteraceae bacterium]|jgi:hypothetical protein|nr:hypothetical protein [Syntrophobacteraceae bacterium]